MEIFEDEIIEENAKQYGHCFRNTILPYEKYFTCIACDYNVKKRKQELTENQL